MKHPLLGLHHVTATVNDAQADLDFYVGVLGLRLVKKTVNFDNHHVYHFYYGDERGTPGTIWTTFPYGGWGVPSGRHGQGQITVTSFSVPQGSLEFWTARCEECRERIASLSLHPEIHALSMVDPSGLILRLVEEQHDDRPPWTGGRISGDVAIRGLDSVTLTLGDPHPTIQLMTQLLSFEVVDQDDRSVKLAVNGDVPGRRVELTYGSGAQPGRNGLGTVHHVAMAIASSDQQVRLRQELIERGYAVTEILDRQYFQSIYFREPGGVLFEVATVQPGFTVDETLTELGEELRLPPWEQSNRPSIERNLPLLHRPSTC